MLRYNSIKDEDIDLKETKSVEKPKPEAGYIIQRAMVRVPGTKRVVKGWEKKRKIKPVGKVGGKSKSDRKKAARRAVRTKKADIKGQRLAKKRSAATRKKSKQAGLIK